MAKKRRSSQFKDTSQVIDIEEARRKLKQTLTDGSAFETFKKFVVAQGGCETEVLNTELLPAAKYQEPVFADADGYVHNIKTEEIML